MINKWDNKATKELFNAILALKNEPEAKRFFRDLLTVPEIIEFGKRWQVAQMLNRGMPYSQIEAETGLSSTTVARISKWLKSGLGGYRLMIARLANHHRPLSLSRKG